MKSNFSHMLIICIVGLLLSVLSCSKERILKIDRTNVPIYSLRGEVLRNDSVLYSSSFNILKDGYIASVVYGTGKLIHLYQIRGDSLVYVCDFLENGNGPYEMGVPDLAYDRKTQRLILKDANRQSGLILDLSDMKNVANTSTWQIINRFTSDMSFLFNNFIVQSDSTLLVLTCMTGAESFLALLNMNQQTGQSLSGFWPEDGFEGDELVKQVEYTLWGSQLLKRPSSNRYFYSSEFGSFAEFFSIKDDMIVDRKNLFPVYPDYCTKDGMNTAQLADTEMGMRACVTDTYVYISLNRGTHGECIRQLESGYLPSDYYGCNTEILVYDWEGNLKKILQLDVPVRSFHVNEEDKMMIAMTQDEHLGEYLISRFNMDGIK